MREKSQNHGLLLGYRVSANKLLYNMPLSTIQAGAVAAGKRTNDQPSSWIPAGPKTAIKLFERGKQESEEGESEKVRKRTNLVAAPGGWKQRRGVMRAMAPRTARGQAMWRREGPSKAYAATPERAERAWPAMTGHGWESGECGAEAMRAAEAPKLPISMKVVSTWPASRW